MNLPELQKGMDEFVFEEFGFHSLYCTTAPSLVYQHVVSAEPASTAALAECTLVVDAGYSFTHIVPVFRGCALNYAVKRINIGGKALTNHLKELVSYRQWNMMEETMVINAVKERLCFVSKPGEFDRDMRLSKKRTHRDSCRLEYVLPTDSSPANPDRFGKVKEKPSDKDKKTDKAAAAEKDKNPDQLLVMGIERFTVPEVLFRPSHIGVEQAGVAEAVDQALQMLHADLRAPMLANIYVAGGCSQLKNYAERLQHEVRALAPEYAQVNVKVPPQGPITAAWHGGAALSKTSTFLQLGHEGRVRREGQRSLPPQV